MEACYNIHLGSVVLQVDYTGLNHFMVQVISLTGTLSDTSKHRVTTMGLGHVVDQLHDQHSLAYTSTTEQTCVHKKIAYLKSCAIFQVQKMSDLLRP